MSPEPIRTEDGRPGPDEGMIREFFGELWVEVLDDDGNLQGGQAVIWCPQTKLSRWATSLEGAVQATLEIGQADHDVYFSVALHDKALAIDAASKKKGRAVPESSVRGCAESATVIYAIATDEDIAGSKHAKKGLPEGEAEILQFLRRLPDALQPSRVVRTGGGLHTWTDLVEPIVITREGDRERAQILLRAHHETWSHVAGYTRDSVFDLARVMRVPGTVNSKYGTLAAVDANLGTKRRANVMDIQEALEQCAPPVQAGRRLGKPVIGCSYQAAVFRFGDESVAPEILAGLLEVSDFEDLWSRRRSLPSQSEYDLALANILAEGDFDDQTMVDVLRHHRYVGGGQPKDRADYYAETIAKARGPRGLNRAPQKAGGTVPARPEVNDDPAQNLVMRWTRDGRKGEVTLFVDFEEGAPYTERFDPMRSTSRLRVAKAITERLGLPEFDAVLDRLDRLAAELTGDDQEPEDGAPGSSCAAELLQIVKREKMKLFHAPGMDTSRTFIAFSRNGHREVWRIDSENLKLYLGGLYRKAEGRPPSTQGLADAIKALQAEAYFDGDEHEVHLRVAGQGDAVYIDLGDDAWEVVEVTKTGWKVIESPACPVFFVRSPSTLSLPRPEGPGAMGGFEELFNVAGEEELRLLVALLVQWLLPAGPYPILAVLGEQGSAKSSLARLIGRLVDPGKAGLRRPPRSEQDLMIHAVNSRLLSFDNISSLTQDLSDCLCTIATGGGMATRKLFTDSEESIFEVQRPILLNGIDGVTPYPDLLDRAVVLELQRIPSSKRRSEADLKGMIEARLPHMLALLLDGVVGVLRFRDQVSVKPFSRMADFELTLAAVERTFGWPAGGLRSAFRRNRQRQHERAMEESAIGDPLMRLLNGNDGQWEGTAAALLQALRDAGEGAYEGSDWPRTPRALSSALRRLNPVLRALGITVRRMRRAGGNRERLIVIRRQGGGGDDGGGGDVEGGSQPTPLDGPGRDGTGTVGQSNRPAKMASPDTKRGTSGRLGRLGRSNADSPGAPPHTARGAHS